MNNNCEMVDIILIGCVNTKCIDAGPAQDVYTSTLWKYRREYAKVHGCCWYILSAKHGLLCPDAWIEPYNKTLTKSSRIDRENWSKQTLSSLTSKFPALSKRGIEFHAGKDYIEYGLEKDLCEMGATVRRPLRGVGIGYQLKSYKEHMASCPRKG